MFFLTENYIFEAASIISFYQDDSPIIGIFLFVNRTLAENNLCVKSYCFKSRSISCGHFLKHLLENSFSEQVRTMQIGFPGSRHCYFYVEFLAFYIVMFWSYTLVVLSAYIVPVINLISCDFFLVVSFI